MKRIYVSSLLLAISLPPCHAQWTAQDSLYLQRILSGKEEIKLNEEVLKNIRLESPVEQGLSQPNLLPDTSHNLLNFDLTVPEFYTAADSLLFRPRRIYLSLRPYGINGFATTAKTPLPFVVRREEILRHERPSIYNHAALAQPGVAGWVNAPIGIGTSIGFSAENVLQYLFSKQGRARLRNATRAKAWKTY